ncbi:oligosaccharide flippase family protein [Bifidobacterium biavatii]|uniref:Na-driven multidrug efflux pump n=1 Tax=Bifidobacterium biavatii DSM 23969 TaxID=1437608 RepID=A0A086ZYJ3_9BIFI|nr:oligosaccharide flippase family protein [Bifidobacterium biavatii]KFI51593.1 Na -driven multidrug efflux pump [Bifidobacterium biavatii DSM 23969]
MGEKKRLLINMTATAVSVMVQLGVNFLLTPYIVRTLGATAYGFIPLINTIIGYTGILTAALNSMSSRYIALEYNRGNYEKANTYFRSVLVANLIIACALAVPGFLFSAFPQWIMRIPAELVQDVRMAFLFAVLSSELSLMLSVYGCVYYVKNRLEKSSVRNIESNLLRAGVLILLFMMLPAKIYYLTATMLIVAIYTNAANVYYTKKLTPELNVRAGRFSMTSVKELLSSGFWNSVDSLSYTLLVALGLYLANVFLGPAIGGDFSLAKTVPAVLLSLAGTMVSVFAPQLMQYYARNRRSEFQKFLLFSLKMSATAYALPVGLFVVFGRHFFELWVPTQDAAHLQAMSVLILIPTLFSCGSMVLNNAFIITDKLKVPAIAFLVCGILNIVLVIPLLLWTSAGIWSIILVQGILDSLKNFLFVPWYASRCLGYSFRTIFLPVLRGICCLMPVIAVCLVYDRLVAIDSWLDFFAGGAVCAILSGVICMFVALNSAERIRVVGMIRRGGR